MTAAAKFAVIVPTYQRAPVLLRALDSVLAQTDPSFGLVVVDDGSTDDTAAVVGRIEDERVSYVRQEHAGVSAARNAGVQASQGEILAFLDSDDEVSPQWLHRLGGGFVDPMCAVVSCGAELVRDGRTRVSAPRRLGPEFGGVTGQFLAGTFAVRRVAFDAAGGYVAGLAYGENTELFLRLAEVCSDRGWRVEAVPDVLVRAYEPDRGAGYAAIQMEGAEYMLDRHADILARNPGTVADLAGTAGVAAARLGEYERARSLLARASRARPSLKTWARLGVAAVPVVARRLWKPAERPVQLAGPHESGVEVGS
jgi:glycosyltransferase involved in cell wall biosynthesis